MAATINVFIQKHNLAIPIQAHYLRDDVVSSLSSSMGRGCILENNVLMISQTFDSNKSYSYLLDEMAQEQPIENIPIPLKELVNFIRDNAQLYERPQLSVKPVFDVVAGNLEMCVIDIENFFMQQKNQPMIKENLPFVVIINPPQTRQIFAVGLSIPVFTTSDCNSNYIQ